MKIFPYIALALLLLVPAACNTRTTPSDAQHNVYVVKQLGDPVYRKNLFSRCAGRFSSAPKNERETVAAAIGVPQGKLGPVVCERLLKGMADGRITASEVDASSRNYLSPRVLKVITGQ